MAMPEPQIYVIDAFCDAPFTGNPAAVCLMEAERGAGWMQSLAAEMNLSETAFISRRGGDFNLRWFTPAVEVDLCGHATLASARALWQAGWCDETEAIVFQSRSGELTATPDAASPEFIWLDFPVKFCEPVEVPPGLLESLGVPAEAVVFVGRNKFDYMVELADETIVRGLVPNYAMMMQVKARGVIVTAKGGLDQSRYDFISRFFAPQSGINEDPVTGSAHCALAPYWGDRLGRNDLVGYQASPRGGFVRVVRQGERVQLGGRALVMTEGRLSAAAWHAE